MILLAGPGADEPPPLPSLPPPPPLNLTYCDGPNVTCEEKKCRTLVLPGEYEIDAGEESRGMEPQGRSRACALVFGIL